MTDEQQERLEQLKARLKGKFQSMAEPMNQISYSKENYDNLFPESKVSTPMGEVKLGEHQFEKLRANDRENLLGAMHQTLTDPIAVINEDREGKKTRLYSKTFNDDKKKLKGIISAVADMNGTKVSISTHRRGPNNILNKIKKAADLLYEKQTSGEVGIPAGNDPYAPNLAISDDTQSIRNIRHLYPDVKGDFDKYFHRQYPMSRA